MEKRDNPLKKLPRLSAELAAGHEKDHDNWLQRFIISQTVYRYLGTTIIAPGGSSSSVRHVINRFADQASLDTWENSEVAISLLEKVNNYSTLQRAVTLLRSISSGRVDDFSNSPLCLGYRVHT